jgi:endonuclease/exonuclease/phosphatase family metal-dependent hydrolase
MLKLVTWNIQWGRGADGKVDLDRIVAQARALGDFDVLCLQEVSSGYPELAGCDGSDQFAALAARLPGFAVLPGIATDAPRPGAGRRAFGNLIASRLPVLQVFAHLLPWPTDPGLKSMQRVALEANLQTPFGVLRVTTTHLEYYSAVQRAAQIERLRELHREACAQAHALRPGDASDGPFEPLPRGVLALLCGDCNFRPEAPERKRLMAPIDAATPGYFDAWEVAHPGRKHAPTVGLFDKEQWPGEPFTFDFVFVGADLAPRVRDVKVDAKADGSDHQPVLVELAAD